MKRLSDPNLSSTLLALLALLLLAFAFQGSRGIYSPDEGYYVGISESMARTGDYLTPRLGSTPWLDKPPLSFWAVAAGLRLLGHNEWGARALHALCYVLTTLLVCSLGRSLYGENDGIRAGVIYATMIMPFVAANIVTPDTPLALATTTAYYCFWKGHRADRWRAGLWNILMCTALGLAFLTKGPAALIPAAAIFAFLLFRRQVPSYFLQGWVPVGLAVFCLVGLGWYTYIVHEFPGALEYFWNNQVTGRTFSTELGRNTGARGALIYFPVYLVGTLPWSAAWWPSLWRRGKRIFHLSSWRWVSDDPAHLLLGTWIAVPVLVLFLASSRLPLYALPVFPALALATSRCISGWPARHASLMNRSGFSPARIGLLALWVAALLGIKLIAAHYPSERDMRALYTSMEEHLPQDGRYEIVSVSDHLEGLGFYDPRLVERVTVARKPYPFFVPPENLEEEVVEIATSDSGHVFVCRSEVDARRVREALTAAGVRFEEVSLPLGYRMFVCKPSGEDGMFRLAVVGGFGEGSARSRRHTVSSAIRLLSAERSLGGILILGDPLPWSARDKRDLASLARARVEEAFAEMLEEEVPFYVVLDEQQREPAPQEFQFGDGRMEMIGAQDNSKVLGGGLVELFILDSDTLTSASDNGCPERLERLDESLSRSRSKWKIVLLHHAIHSLVQSDATHSEPAALLEPILVRRGVALVIQGQSHHYERSSGAQGIMYVSPGGAGSMMQTAEQPTVPGEGFSYERMQVFVLLECDEHDCDLAAYNGLGEVVDEVILGHRVDSG